MRALLVLALACAVHAAPAQQAPNQAGWTLDRIRTALARLEQVPAPPRGVLVLPLATADGKPLATGGALALLAMLTATNVPRQVLAPDAWRYLDDLPALGWYEPAPLSQHASEVAARALDLPTIARGVASDAGPEPELTLTFEGPGGKKEFKHRAKLAALVPWIALRIHEYLGTALKPEERSALEATAIPEAEPARLGEALRRYARSGAALRLALTRAVGAEFPARPECWLLLAQCAREMAPADVPQIVAAGRAAFAGHPYLMLVQLAVDQEGKRWSELLTLGFERLAQDWRCQATYKLLIEAADGLPVAGASEALANAWTKLDPKSARALAFKGHCQLDTAWKLRGEGWANSVKPEAWTQIRALAQGAVEIAERAHQLDPKAMEPVLLMISAQILNGNKATAATWFEKGRAIDPASYQLHSLYLTHLQPRWGGTEQGMLTWAREVARNAPTRDSAPMMLWEAHEDIAEFRNQSGNLPMKSMYFRDKAVYADLKASFDRMLAQPITHLTERDLLARYLLCAYWAVARDDAKLLLARIGDNYGLHVLSNAEFKKIQEWAAQPPAPGDGTVKVKLSYVGRYRIKGTATEFAEDTRKIPCQAGEAFGMQYEVTIPEGGGGAKVRCDVHHPPMKMPGGKVQTVTPGSSVSLRPGQTWKAAATWMFLPDYAYEIVPGKWSQKVFVDDKEVASETFDIGP